MRCLDCNKIFKPAPGARRPEFCSSKCKATFHNRRMQRGAQLHDALVGALADPAWAASNDIEARVRLLVKGWHEADVACGRKRSTKPLFDVNVELPRIRHVDS